MKKTYIGLCGALLSFGANAQGIVIADTFVAPEKSTISEESISPTETYGTYKETPSEPIQSVIHNIKNDTTDPLFLLSDKEILSDTGLEYVDSKIRIGEELLYGITNGFALKANVFYQYDFSHNKERGLSSFDLGAIYRLNDGMGADSRLISDLLFGAKFGGSEHVRSPEYADSSYYAGLRFGRQWNGLSLAGTVKSTWVFDKDRGVSFIDFIPESYFRIGENWRLGLGFDFLVSTNKYLLHNQEKIDFKLVRQFGNTQYVGHIDYEFEEKDFLLGMNVKILF